MVDIFGVFGLSQEQIGAARRIQGALPPELVARARSSAQDLGCFLARMRAAHPDIYAQWQADILRETPTRDTFFSRLPAAEALEGNRLASQLALDRQRLVDLADRLPPALGGGERIRGETLARLAVYDITETPEGCGVASLSPQQDRFAQTRTRPPSMGA